MATDLEKLVVQLSVEMRQYQRALDKANNVTNRRMRDIENRARKAMKNVNASFAGIGNFGKNALGALGVGVSIAGATNLIDGAIRIENALKVADRDGSVCLNSFERFVKWISASIMPPPSLVSAR